MQRANHSGSGVGRDRRGGDFTLHSGWRLGAAVCGSGGRPGATGVLQSAIGNLPELFVGIFALRAGLITVVQWALLGSILANSLLVLGLAFLVGGLRNGTQQFASESPRMIATLTLLAVAAPTLPTLAHMLHTPADAHEDTLSLACANVVGIQLALANTADYAISLILNSSLQVALALTLVLVLLSLW